MIESNSFKMSCGAEAKMEFINEMLYDEFDTNIKLIGFTNGVYNLDPNLFRKGTVEDKVSMTTRYNFSEDFDNEKMEFIDQMIDGNFSTKETSRWFKTHLGSMISDGNKEENGYFWFGNGRDGKGTLDNLLIKC